MSLFKQISIIMSIFLLVVIASVMTLNFKSATKYEQEELYENAQNTAASLSLSLANASGDVPTMSTMINAVFDSGYYKEIRIDSMEGEELYVQTKESNNIHVPYWFLHLFTLDVQSASAHVSAGWVPVGILKVTPLAESAYAKLYNTFIELIQTFVIISLITSMILYLLLHILLKSLQHVRAQAEAVGKNDFIINEDIPYTTEFKEVTLSMNKMVKKVKDIFEKEAQAVNNYHKILYTDTLTGFGNRKYFELKLKNLIHAEDVNANGVILSLFFGGIETANTKIGHNNVDMLLKTFSENIEKTVLFKTNAMKARLDGTKFCVVFPTLHIDDIKIIADNMLQESIREIEQNNLSIDECYVKLSAVEYHSIDTVTSVIKKIEQTISITEKNSICINCAEGVDYSNDIREKRILLEQTLKNETFSIALQPVFDNEMKIFHNEAYIRLMDANKQILPAGTFMPLVHQMNLDTELDKHVIKHTIEYANKTKEQIAINISLRFVQDKANIQWLVNTLQTCSTQLSFELSNNDLLTSLQECISFARSIQENGHLLGIDRFTADSTNLNYLQVLKPSYIKFDSQYLHDMLCDKSGIQNNALQIMIHSLDIKIIATAIEEQSTKDALQKVGIDYFQGSLLAKPKLI